MDEPSSLIALSASVFLATGLASAAALKGWSQWLELRRLELSRRGGVRAGGTRPELAELRARVRRLEAIADGAEL
jgi:hypothetical protein